MSILSKIGAAIAAAVSALVPSVKGTANVELNALKPKIKAAVDSGIHDAVAAVLQATADGSILTNERVRGCIMQAAEKVTTNPAILGLVSFGLLYVDIEPVSHKGSVAVIAALTKAGDKLKTFIDGKRF